MFDTMEDEIIANTLRVRRNELEQALFGETDPVHAAELADELTEVGAEIDRLYLDPDEADRQSEAHLARYGY